MGSDDKRPQNQDGGEGMCMNRGQECTCGEPDDYRPHRQFCKHSTIVRIRSSGKSLFQCKRCSAWFKVKLTNNAGEKLSKEELDKSPFMYQPQKWKPKVNILTKKEVKG